MATTTAEKIKVMQAFVEGNEIEFFNRTLSGQKWVRISHPSWNWEEFDYRVKQTPRDFMLLVDSNNNVLGGADYQFGLVPLTDLYNRIPPNAKLVRVKEVL